MKKLFLVLLLLFVSYNIFSQSKEYSVTLNSGIFIPGSEYSKEFKIGTNIGIDFQDYSYPWSFFTELNCNITDIKVMSFDNIKSTSSSYFIELTAGPRYFFNGKKMQPFFDFGAGAYHIKESDYSYSVSGKYYSVSPKSSTSVGLSTGIGAVINLSKEFDILIKAKYHPFNIIFGGLEFSNYFGVYLGLKYNFNLKKYD
jgi:hypothetical protein